MSLHDRTTNAPAEYSPFTQKTMTVNQACELVGISRRTIYTWIANDRVLWVKTASGRVRIYERSLFHVPPSLDTPKSEVV